MGAHPGAKNSGAKLTTKQVKAIWKRMLKGDSAAAIAADYPSVSYGAICRIGRGESWNCVTGLLKHTPSKRGYYNHDRN